jgi:hypothetical protein
MQDRSAGQDIAGQASCPAIIHGMHPSCHASIMSGIKPVLHHPFLCPYLIPLTSSVSYAMHPSCPASRPIGQASIILPVMHPPCPALALACITYSYSSILTRINPVLHSSCQASIFSCIFLVLHQTCPVSFLSSINTILHQSCPQSILF